MPYDLLPMFWVMGNDCWKYCTDELHCIAEHKILLCMHCDLDLVLIFKNLVFNKVVASLVDEVLSFKTDGYEFESHYEQGFFILRV